MRGVSPSQVTFEVSAAASEAERLTFIFELLVAALLHQFTYQTLQKKKMLINSKPVAHSASLTFPLKQNTNTPGVISVLCSLVISVLLRVFTGGVVGVLGVWEALDGHHRSVVVGVRRVCLL